jgi:protein TonB
MKPDHGSTGSDGRQRRRVRGAGWSAAASGDRLSATLFCAALLHGILILGVTFTVDPPRRDPAPTSLDVVIVTRDAAERSPPRNPALLAQQNLVGRGNAPLDARLRTAIPASPEPAIIAPDRDGRLVEARTPGPRQLAEERLASRSAQLERIRPGNSGETAQAARQRLLTTVTDSTELLANPDLLTVIPDASPRELVVSANTRESRLAGYLNVWKTKVERIGTLNFPNAAELATIQKYPVLEVAIGANGDLREVVVRKSSGYRNLDRAAMEILRIAAPFEPFPRALRQDYDVLRFAYEWRFGAGSSVRGVSGEASATTARNEPRGAT